MHKIKAGNKSPLFFGLAARRLGKYGLKNQISQPAEELDAKVSQRRLCVLIPSYCTAVCIVNLKAAGGAAAGAVRFEGGSVSFASLCLRER